MMLCLAMVVREISEHSPQLWCVGVSAHKKLVKSYKHQHEYCWLWNVIFPSKVKQLQDFGQIIKGPQHCAHPVAVHVYGDSVENEFISCDPLREYRNKEDAFRYGVLKAGQLAIAEMKAYPCWPKSVVPSSGIRSGWLSAWRHAGDSKRFIKQYFMRLEESNNLDGLIDIICDLLEQYGSHYERQSCQLISHHHSMSNIFLAYLRQQQTDVFKAVMNVYYGLQFCNPKEKIRLFRRDTRSPDIIFQKGFTLKNIPENIGASCVAQGLVPCTEDIGISTSRVHPPEHYGPYLYDIYLPADHGLIIIDIIASFETRNNRRVGKGTWLLQEMNSLDNISVNYIKGCYIGKSCSYIKNYEFHTQRGNQVSINNVTPSVTRRC